VFHAVPIVVKHYLGFHNWIQPKSASLPELKEELAASIAAIYVTVAYEISLDRQQEIFNLKWRLSDCENAWHKREEKSCNMY
jgi:hypothetical protein